MAIKTHLPQKRAPAIRNNRADVATDGQLLMSDRTRADILVDLVLGLVGWGGPLEITVSAEALLE